jgi:glucosylceramidase
MSPKAHFAAALGLFLAVAGLFLAVSDTATNAAGEVVSVWMTTADRSRLLQQQSSVVFGADSGSFPTIDVNEGTQYQSIDGFGASLTESSAVVINGMSASARDTLLRNLFSRSGSGIGLSILRNPMGASDFATGNYSYDDTCCDLNDFNINRDMQAIVPIMKQIRAINPNVLLMGVPWSAPGWMKTSGSMNGGWLHWHYYQTHAQYFVKFIQAYQAQGIPVWAVTPQNEPMHETTGYPTMRMEPTDQANFVKNNLGPALRDAGLGGVKIVILDHNWDLINFPRTILNDAAANSFVAGTGWHCYSAGLPNQTTLHNEFPSKDMWHTECSDGGWIGDWAANWDRGMREMTIDVIRHWAKGTIKWNLALNGSNGPTNGGCTNCYGTVTVNGSTVTYNAEYYYLGHASKFVDRGARRIASNEPSPIKSVAFRNPNGGKVLIAYNTGTGSSTFKVRWNGQAFSYTLPGRAAATFTWNTGTATPTTPPRATATATSRPGSTPTATSRPRATATATATPSGGQTIANGTYRIIARHSGKALDVANNGTADGTNVQQWTYGGGNNQRWNVTHLGSGQYQIQSVSANKALDVANVGTTNGSNVHIWTYVAGNNQKWTITSVGSGYYRVSPVHAPALALDVSGPSTADGANVHVWTYGGGTNQQWQFLAP